METHHHYEIVLKKDELLIELSSDDVYFITKQMDKWFRIFLDDSYIPVAIPKPALKIADVPHSPSIQTPIQAVTSYSDNTGKENEPSLPDFFTPNTPPETPRIKERPAEQKSEVTLPEASPPLPMKDDFEAVMDSLMEDLGEATSANGPVELEEKRFTESAPGLPLLTKSKSSLETINSLADLCRKGYASTAEDFLLLSSYYLTFFEAEEKFSLKRINSLMVKTGLTPVNHSVLEAAISKGYLTMVPDLTGLAEVTEYTLMDAGQKNAERLI